MDNIYAYISAHSTIVYIIIISMILGGFIVLAFEHALDNWVEDNNE